jgi:hypothetical protein
LDLLYPPAHTDLPVLLLSDWRGTDRLQLFVFIHWGFGFSGFVARNDLLSDSGVFVVSANQLRFFVFI